MVCGIGRCPFITHHADHLVNLLNFQKFQEIILFQSKFGLINI